MISRLSRVELRMYLLNRTSSDRKNKDSQLIEIVMRNICRKYFA